MSFLIVGDANVGKTAYLTRMATGEFLKEHELTPITGLKLEFCTTLGLLEMKFSEGIVDTENIRGILIMFDVTDRNSYTSVPKWYEMCKNLTSNIVLCGNKTDVKDRAVLAQNITFHRKKGLRYFDVSARSNYNYEKPYLALLRGVYGDELDFVEEVIEAPEIDIGSDC